jgi:hypothetical protein
MKSQADWVALQKAYGNRKISSGRGNVFVSDFTGNLKGALKSELNSSEYRKAQAILSGNGITF